METVLSDAGANPEQAFYWQSEAADPWIKLADDIAYMHRDVTRKLMRIVYVNRGDRILDIGCGTGQSTRAMAERVGPDGKVKGIDISSRMLAAARDRHPKEKAAPPDYELGDAQTFSYEIAGYDRVISQFGMNYFSKPGKAFMNIRRAVRPGATLTFTAWAGEQRNPWFRLPHEAAVREIGGDLQEERDAPGPNSFADASRVAWIMAANGWRNVKGKAHEVILTPPGTLEEAAVFATRMGPAAKLLRHYGGGRAAQKNIALALTDSLKPYWRTGGLQIPAFVNIITAEA